MVEYSCFFAAICFMAANVMKILFFFKERERGHFDWKTYVTLEPDYLEKDWDFRLRTRGLFLSSGFLNAVAWVIFAYPIIQMAWLLSRQGTKSISVNVSIMILAIGGAVTEWLSQLFWIGMNVASTNIVKVFNLDDWVRDDVAASIGAQSTSGVGWRTLEATHVVASGFIWFTDAFEWLCLCGIFIFTFSSVRQWRMEDQTSFGTRWNNLSLFMGLLSFSEFVSEILRFEGFKIFGPIVLIYALLNRIILMPAWIISLGFMLPRAMMKQTYAYDAPGPSEVAMTDVNGRSPTPEFTIGDIEGDNVSGPKSSPPPPEAFDKPPKDDAVGSN